MWLPLNYSRAIDFGHCETKNNKERTKHKFHLVWPPITETNETYLPTRHSHSCSQYPFPSKYVLKMTFVFLSMFFFLLFRSAIFRFLANELRRMPAYFLVSNSMAHNCPIVFYLLPILLLELMCIIKIIICIVIRCLNGRDIDMR